MFVQRRTRTTRRREAVAERSSEGVLVAARPLNRAERVCRRLVEGVHVADGMLLLDADPTWSGAINTVLVKNGVRVNELRRADVRAAL
jgi:hypothetical protein